MNRDKLRVGYIDYDSPEDLYLDLPDEELDRMLEELKKQNGWINTTNDSGT